MSTLPFGAGLGFRRELLPELKSSPDAKIDFFEIAPENWIPAGGRYARDLRQFTERFPFICHGLSLSLGGTLELDKALLQAVKSFMKTHGITLYTEHLSWCADDGHLYDLLPIPCTTEAVKWVANRIQQAQDILGMKIGIENASCYFSPPGAEMTEAEFIRAVVNEADCLLHLDVNNVYVNSRNFGFDPIAYLNTLPLEKVCYLHVAGHYIDQDGLIIDTHGADVIDPVWSLLETVFEHPALTTPTLTTPALTTPALPTPALPVCLERDFNFPSLNRLLKEVDTIRHLQQKHAPRRTQVCA